MTTVPAPPAITVEPSRRSFGVATPRPSPSLTPRPSSVASSASGSSTPVPTLSTSPAFLNEPQRTRSGSQASTEAFADAATKAQAWLSGWAPRGEGRSREFISSTFSNVAGVASTVSQGIGGAVGKGFNENFGKDSRLPLGSRPNSYAGPGSNDNNVIDLDRRLSEEQERPLSPPGPKHTVSTSALPTGRKIPQPANLSRLGPSPGPAPENGLKPSVSQPSISITNRRTSSSGNTSLTSVPMANSTSSTSNLHGPSGLNPNAVHVRSNSASHSRTQSFGKNTHNVGSYTSNGTPGLSRSSSTATGGLSVMGKSAGMPYKIGFQPAGVKHDRTEEFQDERSRRGEERDKEEGRLGRRWAKLVDLHFNPTTASSSIVPALPRSPSSNASISAPMDKRKSLLSFDGAMDALRGPRDVWRGVKTNLDPRGGPAGEESRKRAAEQAVVKWEDDSEVKKCRICQASFNLSNRKHHCRLCGRIVCSLPPTPAGLLAVQMQLFSSDSSSAPSTIPTSASIPAGTRAEKCSLLLVADWKTGRGEEVDEGFVGWMKLQDGEDVNSSGEAKKGLRRKNRLSTASAMTSASSSTVGEDGEKRDVLLPQQPKEVQVKGVRVCRECWAVVSRKQKMADRTRVTGFARLYQALKTLQAEIDDMMPDFEEQMEILTSSGQIGEPGREVLAIHKQLVALFAQYEHLSKRMSSLPAAEGSNQQTVQGAVARTTATFLAMGMVKIQALPKLQKRVAEMKRQGLSTAILETTLAEQLRLEGVEEAQAVDVAILLQPLLEQEAQLEAMISDANAQRKYEDSKALGQALEEIRAEIAKETERAAF